MAKKPAASPSGHHVYSWQEYEGMKSRAACAMDRVEFLTNTRNRFTDFRAQEADHQRFILRSRSQPMMQFAGNLSKSRPAASKLFDQQVKAAQDYKSRTKRMHAMNDYVIDHEMKRGKEHGLAAKTAAANTLPADKPYPLYDELHNAHEAGQRRLSPELARSIPLGYEIADDALRHGTGKLKKKNSTAQW